MTLKQELIDTLLDYFDHHKSITTIPDVSEPYTYVTYYHDEGEVYYYVNYLTGIVLVGSSYENAEPMAEFMYNFIEDGRNIWFNPLKRSKSINTN